MLFRSPATHGGDAATGPRPSEVSATRPRTARPHPSEAVDPAIGAWIRPRQPSAARSDEDVGWEEEKGGREREKGVGALVEPASAWPRAATGGGARGGLWAAARGTSRVANKSGAGGGGCDGIQ